MSGSVFGEKDPAFGACSMASGFEARRNAYVTLQCSLSVVASRARKWPDLPAGMIDLLSYEGDLDVLFED